MAGRRGFFSSSPSLADLHCRHRQIVLRRRVSLLTAASHRPTSRRPASCHPGHMAHPSIIPQRAPFRLPKSNLTIINSTSSHHRQLIDLTTRENCHATHVYPGYPFSGGRKPTSCSLTFLSRNTNTSAASHVSPDRPGLSKRTDPLPFLKQSATCISANTPPQTINSFASRPRLFASLRTGSQTSLSTNDILSRLCRSQLPCS